MSTKTPVTPPLSAREALLRRLLPASFQKLPFVRYRQREAQTAGEYLSDVEFGVKSAKDLSDRVANLPRNPRGSTGSSGS
jgi:hypothetical protein